MDGNLFNSTTIVSCKGNHQVLKFCFLIGLTIWPSRLLLRSLLTLLSLSNSCFLVFCLLVIPPNGLLNFPPAFLGSASLLTLELADIIPLFKSSCSGVLPLVTVTTMLIMKRKRTKLFIFWMGEWNQTEKCAVLGSNNNRELSWELDFST